MAKRPEIKAVSYIHAGGECYRFDELPPDKRKEYVGRMMENIGKAVSEHLNTHPEEIKRFLEGT